MEFEICFWNCKPKPNQFLKYFFIYSSEPSLIEQKNQIQQLKNRINFNGSVRINQFKTMQSNRKNDPHKNEKVIRILPDIYIRGTSQEGKIIFKQALQQGNMECYFPLIQQFTTQIQPQTCGPTSLVMVLNSLGVDPNKTFKGIWRWYTEENLNLMTKQILKSGPNQTHIARHNHLDVSTFYYPKFDNTVIQNLIELNQQCEDCKQPLKTASYQTFRDCILSSERRQGFILTLNHSRKKLLQTGIGHYSPIGGYNKKRNLVLMLDVARFKYQEVLFQYLSKYKTDLKFTMVVQIILVQNIFIQN